VTGKQLPAHHWLGTGLVGWCPGGAAVDATGGRVAARRATSRQETALCFGFEVDRIAADRGAMTARPD